MAFGKNLQIPQVGPANYNLGGGGGFGQIRDPEKAPDVSAAIGGAIVKVSEGLMKATQANAIRIKEEHDKTELAKAQSLYDIQTTTLISNWDAIHKRKDIKWEESPRIFMQELERISVKVGADLSPNVAQAFNIYVKETLGVKNHAIFAIRNKALLHTAQDNAALTVNHMLSAIPSADKEQGREILNNTTKFVTERIREGSLSSESLNQIKAARKAYDKNWAVKDLFNFHGGNATNVFKSMSSRGFTTNMWKITVDGKEVEILPGNWSAREEVLGLIEAQSKRLEDNNIKEMEKNFTDFNKDWRDACLVDGSSILSQECRDVINSMPKYNMTAENEEKYRKWYNNEVEEGVSERYMQAFELMFYNNYGAGRVYKTSDLIDWVSRNAALINDPNVYHSYQQRLENRKDSETPPDGLAVMNEHFGRLDQHFSDNRQNASTRLAFIKAGTARDPVTNEIINPNDRPGKKALGEAQETYNNALAQSEAYRDRHMYATKLYVEWYNSFIASNNNAPTKTQIDEKISEILVMTAPPAQEQVRLWGFLWKTDEYEPIRDDRKVSPETMKAHVQAIRNSTIVNPKENYNVMANPNQYSKPVDPLNPEEDKFFPLLSYVLPTPNTDSNGANQTSFPIEYSEQSIELLRLQRSSQNRISLNSPVILNNLTPHTDSHLYPGVVMTGPERQLAGGKQYLHPNINAGQDFIQISLNRKGQTVTLSELRNYETPNNQGVYQATSLASMRFLEIEIDNWIATPGSITILKNNIPVSDIEEQREILLNNDFWTRDVGAFSIPNTDQMHQNLYGQDSLPSRAAENLSFGRKAFNAVIGDDEIMLEDVELRNYFEDFDNEDSFIEAVTYNPKDPQNLDNISLTVRLTPDSKNNRGSTVLGTGTIVEIMSAGTRDFSADSRDLNPVIYVPVRYKVNRTGGPSSFIGWVSQKYLKFDVPEE